MMGRVAISQTSNSEDLPEQFANVIAHLDLAHSEGADMVIYPELSMTGYNRAVPIHLKTPDIESRLNAALEACDVCCRELNLRALVGRPVFDDEKPLPLNAMTLLGSSERETWYKAVPWRGEVNIFSGHEGLRYQNGLGVLICSDWDRCFRDLEPDTTIAWPGIMSREWADDPSHEFFDAIRTLNLTVYYANWPSAPNPPTNKTIKEGGQSCMMTAKGIEVEAPKSIPGLLKCYDDLSFIPTSEHGT